MDFSSDIPTFPFPEPTSYLFAGGLEKAAAGCFPSHFAGLLIISCFCAAIYPQAKDAYSHAL